MNKTSLINLLFLTSTLNIYYYFTFLKKMSLKNISKLNQEDTFFTISINTHFKILLIGSKKILEQENINNI